MTGGDLLSFPERLLRVALRRLLSLWVQVQVFPEPLAITGDSPVTLHYTDSGGDGRPVVLIHGWPLSGAALDKIYSDSFIFQNEAAAVAELSEQS